MKFLGDLTAGLAAADHQHLSRRECCGIPVALGVDHEKSGRELRRNVWTVRALKGTRAHHDRLRLHVARRRAQQEPILGPGLQTLDADAFANGRR
jgi:hypothetical protein